MSLLQCIFLIPRAVASFKVFVHSPWVSSLVVRFSLAFLFDRLVLYCYSLPLYVTFIYPRFPFSFSQFLYICFFFSSFPFLFLSLKNLHFILHLILPIYYFLSCPFYFLILYLCFNSCVSFSTFSHQTLDLLSFCCFLLFISLFEFTISFLIYFTSSLHLSSYFNPLFLSSFLCFYPSSLLILLILFQLNLQQPFLFKSFNMISFHFF